MASRLLLVLLLASSWAARAQPLTPSAARADLDTLEHTLEQNAAYLWVNGYDTARHLDSLRAAYRTADAVPVRQLALDVSRLVGRLADGHSNVGLANGEDLDDGYNELPFPVARVGGRVVALAPDYGGLLVPGHPQLVAINGVPTARLMALVGARYRGHGPARYLSRATDQLTKGGYALDLAGALRGDSIAVRLASDDGARPDTTIHTALVPFGPRRVGAVEPFAASLLRANVAYLRIPDMVSPDDPEEAFGLDVVRAAMESEAFAGSDGLILDVRGNGGGTRDVLRYLLPFLISEPLVYNAAFPRRDTLGLAGRGLYRPDDARLDASSQRAAHAFTERFEPSPDLPRADFLNALFVAVQPDAPTPYDYSDRPVVVLVDAGAFSATDVFLGALAELPNVTLVGTTSAGGSGRSRWFELPHSGIGVKLSTMASFRPDGQLYDGRGVAPDIVAEPTLGDVLGATDTPLLRGHRVLRQQIRQRAGDER